LAIAPVRDAYQRLRQFTADASHELRNPIATIQTNVQVALADPEPHMQAEQLRTIERLTRRLGRLVDDLLFLARQDSGSLAPRNQWVDLAQLLQSMIDEQQVIAHQQGIALTLAIAADLTNQPDSSAHPSPDSKTHPSPNSKTHPSPNSKTHPSPNSSPDPSTSTHSSTHSSAPLGGNPRPDPPKTEPTSISPSRMWGDRDRLTRLLLNPIANALQHTPPGGQVTVTLSRLDTPRRAPTALQITIADTGSGIPADALPHLFDRFYRVDRARTRTASATGSGLGLAIAHSIATSYRGAIAISSTLHQGTQVHITLPQLPSTETRPPHA
jgi:OmpR-family two-component system manganese-sensing sensor histidine kinase